MNQEIIDIEKIDLLNRALGMKNDGRRLAQICATKTDRLILLYSFVKDNELTTLRFFIAPGETVESVSFLYPYAFLYENEMKDLYGIEVMNMNVDFGGHFYETRIKTPFSRASDGEGEPADG